MINSRFIIGEKKQKIHHGSPILGGFHLIDPLMLNLGKSLLHQAKATSAQVARLK
jgi:hypothetical protein